MYSVALRGPGFLKGFTCFYAVSRSLCRRPGKGDDVENGFGRIEDFFDESWKNSSNLEEKALTLDDSCGSLECRGDSEVRNPGNVGRRLGNGDDVENGFGRIEDFLNEPWKSSVLENGLEEKALSLDDSFDSWGCRGDLEDRTPGNVCGRKSFVDGVKSDAARILEVLKQYYPGFDVRLALSSLGVRVSGPLVREVLFGILKEVNYVNKDRWVNLVLKFFSWSGEQENYRHPTSVYHMMMKIFAEISEFKEMTKLFGEMIEKGYRITARTFNILICTCCGAGIPRKKVASLIRSIKFNYGDSKNSFNAILHSLLTINEYRLTEWVYQQMLAEGHLPDVLTYNVVMCAKFRLGKKHEAQELLDEMVVRGFSPDLHTFNLFLHIHAIEGDRGGAAKLLNHMKKIGICPTVLHYTTLIDGFSRAGDLEACEILFSDMINQGCVPDVVCYTVLITSYVVAGHFDIAQQIFAEMIVKGQLPNVFTYNSMIRGLCMARRFEEACSMLKVMESKGCNPNFTVYTTLVVYLRKARKLSEAHEVIRHMVEKGQYIHRLDKILRYKMS